MADVKPYEGLLPLVIRILQDPTNEKLKRKGYTEAVNHAKEMAVHLYGTKPIDLLNRVRPREDPAITAYRLESYEPTTTSSAGKALTLTNKIFNPKLYGIKQGEGSEAETLFHYAMEEYPVFNTVVNFLSEFGMKKNMADPNGLYLVEPGEIPLIYENGEARVDITKQIAPIVTTIDSCDIWVLTPEYGFFFVKKTQEKVGDSAQEIDVWYFKYVDRQGVYDFYLYTLNAQQYYNVLLKSYMHKFNELPCWPMGGAYDQKIIGLYQSLFYPAVPFWNKSITAESDLDGAFISHLHPQKWQVAEECEYVENTDHGNFACDRGWIYDPQNKGGKYHCQACGGSGRKSVKGPHSQYWVTRDKLSDPNGNTLSQPPAGYIDVPTAATQMLVDRAQKLREDGLSALNMDIVNKIGNNQSGEAKAYDRTELFDFLAKVTDLFYDKHMVNIFYYFAKYMFIGKSDEQLESIQPTVIKPNDFDILTTSELMEQIKVGKDSNINPEYLRAKNIEVNNREFGNHPDVLRHLNLVTALQPYSGYGRTDIQLMILDGTASKQMVVIHDNIDAFVRRAIEENENFPDLEYLEKMEILKGYADEELETIEEENKVALEAAQAAMIQPDNLDPNTPNDTGNPQ